MCSARPCCLRLLAHWIRAAASRTFCTAGSSKPIRTAMMAITTSSSINVNPERRGERDIIKTLLILPPALDDLRRQAYSLPSVPASEKCHKLDDVPECPADSLVALPLTHWFSPPGVEGCNESSR